MFDYYFQKWLSNRNANSIAQYPDAERTDPGSQGKNYRANILTVSLFFFTLFTCICTLPTIILNSAQSSIVCTLSSLISAVIYIVLRFTDKRKPSSTAQINTRLEWMRSEILPLFQTCGITTFDQVNELRMQATTLLQQAFERRTRFSNSIISICATSFISSCATLLIAYPIEATNSSNSLGLAPVGLYVFSVVCLVILASFGIVLLRNIAYETHSRHRTVDLEEFCGDLNSLALFLLLTPPKKTTSG